MPESPRASGRRIEHARLMKNFVYLLGCSDKNGVRTYVGWTNDLPRRLLKHNAGKGARSTRGRAWTLLYAECLANRRDAMSREWHLKKNRRLRKQLAEGLRCRSDEVRER